jgi:hypothetical protein
VSTPSSALAGDSRQARLTSAVARLRTRVTGGSAERWFRIAGPALMPLGALVILLGWYGAAHTTRLFLQIPYLISGGILGLGLMFAGGFVYFARWMTDLLLETRKQATDAEATAARTAAALERIEALLREGAAGATSIAADTALVTTANGRLVHRPDCRMVVGREVKPVRAGASLDPCGICQPDIATEEEP